MERGLDLDLHVDESGDGGARALIEIARAAVRLGFKGHLQCGHCCSLAVQDEEFVLETLGAVANAGIAIVSLPMCNMYLQGRTAGKTPRWRGITLLHELKAEGIKVSIASDNCRDPFYAYGDHDMLEVMTQATRIAHLDHPFGDWPTAFTAVPAAVMGLSDRGRLRWAIRPTWCCCRPASCPRCCRVPRATASCCATVAPSTPRCPTIATSTPARSQRVNDLRDALSGLELIDHPVQLRQRSRDFYWYSPILKRQLDGKAADLIAVPRSIEEVMRVAAACARLRVPLGVRGGATGNYGQMVPLQGGVLLDMARLDRTLWIERGRGRFEAGVRLEAADTAAQQSGWELRMFPSTRRQATVGGYVCGGAAGVGSIRYGQLRDSGSVLALKVVTCEETPRLIELRGADIGKALHAYAPRASWSKSSCRLRPLSLDRDGGGLRRLRRRGTLRPGARPVRRIIPEARQPDGMAAAALLPRARRGRPAEGQHVVMIMVAAGGEAGVAALAAEHGGAITLQRPYREERGHTPLYEYTWNHTTLQALKVDKDITYLQTIFPPESNVAALIASHEMFGEEVMAHAEFQRRLGRTNCSSLQVVRYTSDERLWEIVRQMETLGIKLSNPHSYILEDKGARVPSADLQLAFKHESDPHGLLNRER